MKNIESEKQTLETMLRHYCKKKHLQDSLCEVCQKLLSYALKKLDNCRYGARKTSCRKCPTHCYAPAERAQIKLVMKYSGPRMLWLAPLAKIFH